MSARRKIDFFFLHGGSFVASLTTTHNRARKFFSFFFCYQQPLRTEVFRVLFASLQLCNEIRWSANLSGRSRTSKTLIQSTIIMTVLERQRERWEEKKNFPTVVKIENSWCREFAWIRGMIRKGKGEPWTCVCVFIAFHCCRFREKSTKQHLINPLSITCNLTMLRCSFVM